MTFFSLLHNVITLCVCVCVCVCVRACVWNAILWKPFLFLQRFKEVQIQLKVQLYNKTCFKTMIIQKNNAKIKLRVSALLYECRHSGSMVGSPTPLKIIPPPPKGWTTPSEEETKHSLEPLF